MLHSQVTATGLGDGSLHIQTTPNHFKGEMNSTGLLQGIKELQTASEILLNPL